VIGFNSFTINFSPENILLSLVGSKNQDAVLAPEKGSVGDNDGFAGDYITLWKFVVLKLFPDPIDAPVVVSS
jgi:hypothetical protein